MKPGFRQSMAWLHTWSGLLVGWVLFAVFLTGTAAYLRPEISLWMRPELEVTRPGPDIAPRLMEAMARLAPGSPNWSIGMPTARDPVARVFWRDPQAPNRRGFRDAALHPATGEVLTARATRGGEFFYRFHFDLHYMSPIVARWIVSACAMFMLVAIISGIVTHRRIFADFFTFRPGKGQRSWLDGHAVAAVLALPYHLMITYTGLVTLMFLTMPWGAQLAYKGDRAAMNADIFGNAPVTRPAGRPAPLVGIGPLVEEAARRWEGGSVGRITVQNPGDARATIQLVRQDSERISFNPQSLLFDGTTGALISATGEAALPAAETRGVMYGLHVGRFAGPLLRGLFLLSGLAGSVMVATGCILWAVKMRQQAAKRGRVGFGTRLVEHLNVAAIAGLPVAMGAFFWANRLLPAQMEGRAEWEIHLFFAAWGLCLLHPLLRRGRQAWVEQLGLGALLFGLLPLLNLLVTRRHLGITLAEGDWIRAGFDLGLLAIGGALGAIAWMVARPKVAGARAERTAASPLATAEAAE
ncbi:PepSY-associated TM helix domain-containing protein [Belnapia rosea]|uniref:PepSY-associated TM helix domain-containing protein n=1 Tax=Belnapia rosea TaxID=938405 RepID=UPI00088E71B7|nr:PepSY-associated TM helix domain-containing protein [Belnapia rosea]SDB74042.1 Uncharacterized iron-regulated membrane protein [Belnapia rosea]